MYTQPFTIRFPCLKSYNAGQTKKSIFFDLDWSQDHHNLCNASSKSVPATERIIGVFWMVICHVMRAHCSIYLASVLLFSFSLNEGGRSSLRIICRQSWKKQKVTDFKQLTFYLIYIEPLSLDRIVVHTGWYRFKTSLPASIPLNRIVMGSSGILKQTDLKQLTFYYRRVIGAIGDMSITVR